MGQYDDKHEAWWQPFQCHWKLDDEQWMLERKILWKKIRSGQLVDKIDNEDELRGLRNLFVTGQNFDRFYDTENMVDFSSIDRMIAARVDDHDRLFMLPVCDSSVQMEFCQLMMESERGFEEITSIFYFRRISMFYSDTDLAHDIIISIYNNIMGGGLISENTALLQVLGEEPIGYLNSELKKYFDYLRFELNTEGRDVRYLDELFSYYASLSKWLCDYEDELYKKFYPNISGDIDEKMDSASNRRERKLRSSWAYSIEMLYKPLKCLDADRVRIIENARSLVSSSDFPSVYKTFLS